MGVVFQPLPPSLAEPDLARPASRRRFNGQLGMMVFLGSWAMLFASLFFAYAVLRLRQPMWPPAGSPTLPTTLPFINTVIIAASSVTLWRGVSALRAGSVAGLMGWLGATLVLGVGFLGLQIASFGQLGRLGLHVDSNVLGSVVYSFGVFHALHVICGVIALVLLLLAALRDRIHPGAPERVELTAHFWHFVGAVWLLLYAAVYVI